MHDLDVVDVAARLRAGAVSAVELTEHLLERIGKLDPLLHSYAFLDADNARMQAREADERIRAGNVGPLAGVPIAVKDLFWTHDMPTSAGMPIHRDFRASEDATAVRRLREAGAVIPGKLQMTEGAFALHHPSVAPPLNPWGETLWPGASSSGSGVAVAAGLSFASLGSDTGGSIRFPCAANGLTGLKPSWGRVSRHGAFELAASLDHVGPIAKSARDVALLYGLVAGHDPADPTSWAGTPGLLSCGEDDLRGIRIGIDPQVNADGVDDDIVSALAGVLDVLREAGGTLCDVGLPDLRRAAARWELLAGVEAATAHAQTYPRFAQSYGPALSRLIGLGREASAMTFQAACLDRMHVRGALDAVLAGIDILMLPVQPFAAPTLERLGALAEDPDANTRLIAFTAPFNLGGHPAISLPCAPTPGGFPLGFQMIAARGREDMLLRAACVFQHRTSWHLRRPQVGEG